MSACMFIKFQCSRLSFTASVLKIQRGQSSLVVRTPSEVKGVGKSSHSSLGKWARVKGKQQHPQIQWDLLGMFGLREESEKYHCENSDGVYTVTMLETRLRCPCISCCLDLASPKLVVLVWVLFFLFLFTVISLGLCCFCLFVYYFGGICVFNSVTWTTSPTITREEGSWEFFGSVKYHGCGRKEETWESQKAIVLHKFMIRRSWATNITRREEVKFYKGTPIV